MPKKKNIINWVCIECGYVSPSYIGKCTECNAWGSLVEEKFSKETKAPTNKDISFSPISEVDINELSRTTTFDKELDEVLGGGFVPGSLTLLAGEPGIGKSTILLQIANHLALNKKVAYVSAEESTYQVKLRAKRLNLENNILLLSENNLAPCLNEIEKESPDFLIIDSIQAIYHDELESSAGSVSQVKECSNKLLRLAKDKNITTIIVGHVNKDGQVAGPKVLEHIVDTVLYFEGEKFHNFRLLRATKNRFGCTDEIAVFSMKEDGLHPIPNPSFLFMSENEGKTPGSAYCAITEGNKTIIAEIQSLVGSTSYAAPRRVANGLDYNRVQQIIAILERRVGFNFSKHDLYTNLVGGLSSYEPALDLAIAMATVSCKQDVAPSKKTVYIGEIGLTGEIRQVNHIENRIKEAIKLGFERAVIPKSAKGNSISKTIKKQIEVIETEKVLDAIRETMSVQNEMINN